ncbi:hypothetical protein QMK17_09915 [Rhodococcus sp. G-MC3]|uniref:hypothetical protein n=1 Tax=Rhodococcus sp. G-MC3 TaxID=3046209 RepID=UPI0024BB51F2|nr:hypothetical protein [Rhodococcus sp. G-MC3]MDJ0393645.1 hypothetical protein [Rhodococcus sp. G-MC3]
MTDEFGVTAWGREWTRLAQPTKIIRPNPALPRARVLARNDNVRDVVLLAGSVTASVSTSDTSDYRVTVTFPTWDARRSAAAHEVVDGVSDGDLPDTLHAALRMRGVSVAPLVDELTAVCGCTQRVRPCVHILATYFEVARRIDENPRSGLLLRGFDPRSMSGASQVTLDDIDPTTFYSQGKTVSAGHSVVHRAALDS